MKKHLVLISLLLIAVLMLSLVSCTDRKKQNSDDSETTPVAGETTPAPTGDSNGGGSNGGSNGGGIPENDQYPGFGSPIPW